uniref:Beta-defensin-like domain-containing protein n=1 Tax=Chelonoidis abingdonii TaxID=106734 RepID=A0A8C0FW28_CHEAB
MKILYLLFAVFFLVLQAFSQAQNSSFLCKRLWGTCVLRRCPPNWRFIGRCSSVQVCCVRYVQLSTSSRPGCLQTMVHTSL